MPPLTSYWYARLLATKSSNLQRIIQALSKKLREPVTLWVVGSFAVACIAAAPLFLNQGFLNTRSAGDSPFLLFRLHQLHQGLLDGVFPVRWMPDAAFGLGYPFFNFYAALPFYFAAIFKLVGFSFVFSLKLTHLLGFIVASIGMAAWMWQLTKRVEVAFVAAAAYTFAPFHLVNVYLRGDSLSEFWAMAWYPLILLTLHMAAQHLTWKRIALVALTFGALVMTHNVSALLFAPFVAIYAVGSALVTAQRDAPLSLSKQRQLNAIIGLALAGVIGLLLSLWLWLPALTETSFVQLDEQTTGFFSYTNHFRTDELIQQELAFNYTFGRDGFSPFSIGTLQAVLTLLGTGMLLRWAVSHRLRWQAAFIIIGILLTTWMITPTSVIVWENLPLLPLAQFPWRFLSIVALFSSAAIGFILPETLRPPLRLANEQANIKALSNEWKAFASIALTIILTVGGLSELDLNFIQVQDTDVNAERLQIYEAYSGNIGTTIRFEYLPRWVQPRPYASDILLGREPQVKFVSGQGAGQRIEASTHQQEWTLSIEEGPATVALPLLYYPGWSAKLEGQRIELRPLEGLGFVQFDVPEGEHQLSLKLRPTPLRRIAEFGSLVALLSILVMVRPSKLSIGRQQLVAWGSGILAVALTGVVLRALPEPTQTTHLLSADFSQEAFHHAGDVRFFNQPHIIDTAFVANDEQLTYELVWDQARNEPTLSVMLELVGPPQQNQQGAPTQVLSEQILGSNMLAGQQDITGMTPGMYFPWVEVALIEDTPAPITLNPMTAGGQTRGDTVLNPIVVQPAPANNIEATGQFEAFGPLQLLDVQANNSYEQLNIRLWWRTDSSPLKDYAIAFRLRDQAGNVWSALDTQAGGAGLYPTGLWLTDEIIPDNYRLTLPRGTPPSDAYDLEITLYDAATLEAVNSSIASGIGYGFVSRASCQEEASTLLYEALRIRDATASFDGGQLNSAVEWTICGDIPEDYQLRWFLTQGEDDIWQTSTPLVIGSQPSTWARQEGFGGYVQGIYQFADLPQLAEGTYTLSFTLRSEDNDVLAYDTLGEVVLDQPLRQFDQPLAVSTIDAVFGEVVALSGYGIEQSSDTLTLDLIWRALQAPEVDYQYFVHLFDPTTEAIVAQVDSMPRNFTYPTSRWAEAEFIDERVDLAITDVPAGDYRLAVGWYAITDGARLTAAVDGEPIADNRVILPDIITFD